MSENCALYGGGNCGTTPTTSVATVPGNPARPVSNDGLPFTGGDVLGLGLIGSGMLVAGIVLARLKQR